MKSPQAWASKPADAGLGGAGRDQRSARRRHGARIAGTAITALLASTLVPASTAFAATPPVPPNNVVIFPDRDFVVLEGYQNRIGQFATITARRGGNLIGRAEGLIADEGPSQAPALEVNHPGGVCWGTGAGAPQITPDLKPGDVVTVDFNGAGSDSAVTQSPTVTGYNRPTPNTVVVDGTLGALGGPRANTANFEQRIVNPALTETSVRRRDVRAGDSLAGSFTSRVAFSATNFTATYTFNDPAVAAVAAAGQARALTWMATDAAANRQGMTISEFEELGGAGFGGCPTGTLAPPKAPTTPAMGPAKAGFASALVTWREQADGGAPLTGYTIKVFNSSNQLVVSRAALPGDSSFTQTGLKNQPYRFTISARNRIGSSAYSAPSNFVTPKVVPGAARIATAYSGNVGGPVNAVARWMPPLTTGGAAINGYVVTALRIASNGSVASRSRSAVISASGRTYWYPLARGYYRFQVQARNVAGFGALSGMSAQVIAR